MNDTCIISKMNEYMFQLNSRMGSWLSKKLPKITDNWWQELVLNNLILENNSYQHLSDERKQRVKNLFKGYKTLTGTMKQV